MNGRDYGNGMKVRLVHAVCLLAEDCYIYPPIVEETFPTYK